MDQNLHVMNVMNPWVSSNSAIPFFARILQEFQSIGEILNLEIKFFVVGRLVQAIKMLQMYPPLLSVVESRAGKVMLNANDLQGRG